MPCGTCLAVPVPRRGTGTCGNGPPVRSLSGTSPPNLSSCPSDVAPLVDLPCRSDKHPHEEPHCRTLNTTEAKSEGLGGNHLGILSCSPICPSRLHPNQPKQAAGSRKSRRATRRHKPAGNILQGKREQDGPPAEKLHPLSVVAVLPVESAPWPPRSADPKRAPFRLSAPRQPSVPEDPRSGANSPATGACQAPRPLSPPRRRPSAWKAPTSSRPEMLPAAEPG